MITEKDIKYEQQIKQLGDEIKKLKTKDEGMAEENRQLKIYLSEIQEKLRGAANELSLALQLVQKYKR